MTRIAKKCMALGLPLPPLVAIPMALMLVTTASCATRTFDNKGNLATIGQYNPAVNIPKALFALTEKGKALGLVNTTTSRAEWKAQLRLQPTAGTVPADPRTVIEKILMPEFEAKAKSENNPAFSLKKRDYVAQGFAAKTRTEYRFTMSYLSPPGDQGRPTTLKLRVRDYENVAYDEADDFKGRRFTKSALAKTPRETPDITGWKEKFNNPQDIRFWEYKENINAFDTSEGNTVFVNKHRLALIKSDIDSFMASKSGLELAVQNRKGDTPFNITDYWLTDDKQIIENIKQRFAGAINALNNGKAVASIPFDQQEVDLGVVMVDLEKGKALMATTDEENFRERTYYLNYQMADFHKFMRNDDPYPAEPYILTLGEILQTSLGSASTQIKSDEQLLELLQGKKDRLKVLGQRVQEWCDVMFQTTQTLFQETGLAEFRPMYAIEYVRNSYEASFPVYVLKTGQPEDSGVWSSTKVQMTVDRDIQLSFFSGQTQQRMAPWSNERIFPRDLVVFEQKFDPDFIDVSYDPLALPKANSPRETANKVTLSKSWGLEKMYNLRKDFYAAPTGQDKRSGKAADVPKFIPEKFFLTWADPQGRLNYMLSNRKQILRNQTDLFLISWDNRFRGLTKRLKEVIGRPDADQRVSFETMDQALIEGTKDSD